MNFDDLVILGMVNSNDMSGSIGEIPVDRKTTESNSQLSIKNVNSVEFANSGSIYLPNEVVTPDKIKLRQTDVKKDKNEHKMLCFAQTISPVRRRFFMP